MYYNSMPRDIWLQIASIQPISAAGPRIRVSRPAATRPTL